MQKQLRVVIDRISPHINGGAYYIKRVVGQLIDVSADVLADGHDVLAVSILYKHQSDRRWLETRMYPGHNEEWCGSFQVD